MHVLMSLFAAALFFALVPGILVTLPKKGSNVKVALVHALIFAVVYYFLHMMVWHANEGFSNPKSPDGGICPPPSALKNGLCHQLNGTYTLAQGTISTRDKFMCSDSIKGWCLKGSTCTKGSSTCSFTAKDPIYSNVYPRYYSPRGPKPKGYPSITQKF
jgi:uncharacterized membrane protein